MTAVLLVALLGACGRGSESTPLALRPAPSTLPTAATTGAGPDDPPDGEMRASTSTAPLAPVSPTTTEAPSLTAVGEPRGTYTDWHWPTPQPGLSGYRQQELELTVVSDPGSSESYFYAHQVVFEQGAGGYVGLQTRAATAAGPGAPMGKIAIFSIFGGCDVNAGTHGCARGLLGLGAPATEPGPANGSFCLPLTDARGRAPEGPGATCRVAFEWREGITYRLRITEVAPDVWQADVVDTTMGTTVTVGRIRVPQPWGGLGTFSVSWIEYYGTSRRSLDCRGVPATVARWASATGLRPDRPGGLLGLGAASTRVSPSSISSHLAVGTGMCPNSSIVELAPPGQGAIQRVGGDT